MDDAFLVRRGDGIRQRDRDVEELLEREAFFRKNLGQGLALHELHRHEVNAICPLDRIDVEDVRMIERRDNFGLTLKTLSAMVVLGELGRQYLRRDLTLELSIEGFCRPLPASRADGLDDLEMGELCSWC
jgi:hypothetical protein